MPKHRDVHCCSFMCFHYRPGIGCRFQYPFPRSARVVRVRFTDKQISSIHSTFCSFVVTYVYFVFLWSDGLYLLNVVPYHARHSQLISVRMVPGEFLHAFSFILYY